MSASCDGVIEDLSDSEAEGRYLEEDGESILGVAEESPKPRPSRAFMRWKAEGRGRSTF